MLIVDKFAPDVVDLTRQLCDIPSVSGNERVLADAIETQLRTVAHLQVTRHQDAVIARTELGRERRVIIAGHLDTVPIVANVPSELRTLTDGTAVLWGRGSVDMKAGVAVQLALALEISEPTVDLTFIFYDHEEVDASLNGLGRISRELPELLAADFAILAEPTGGHIEGGCNGTLRLEVRTTGRKAHSARSWLGENAIHAAAPILQRLADYQAQSIEVDGLTYREGLNAVGISGGIATNVIPDECVVTINYRFAPSRSVAEAKAHVQEIFAPWQVRIVDEAAGARPGLTDPAVAQFCGIGQNQNPDLQVRAKLGWTDVARFAELGIPALNFGPGDPGLAHADDEHCPTQQITDVHSVLHRWLTT